MFFFTSVCQYFVTREVINEKVREIVKLSLNKKQTNYCSSAVRIAPEMFKTGVLSMYYHYYYRLTVNLTFSRVGETQTFLLPLSSFF